MIGHTPVKVACIPTLLALLDGSDNAKNDADRALLRKLASAPSYPCPCCGYFVFEEPPGSFAICPICFWEDDEVQLRFPTLAVGANRASLMDAQRNFQRLGASEPRFVQNCRPPTPADRRDPSWRPLDVSIDNILSPPPGTQTQAYPDTTRFYYWRENYWRRT